MKNSLLFLLFVSILSCSKQDNNHEIVSVDAALANVISEKNDTKDQYVPVPPNTIEEKEIYANSLEIASKIIKSGDLEIEVGDMKKAQKIVTDNLKKLNAYKQGEYFSNGDSQEMLKMTIRVPNQNFDNLLQSFSSELGNVISNRIVTDDVTEEYTDVSIRLENKFVYLEKYRDLLKKTTNTKDILEIQENIRSLEEEIESSKGRLRFIDDKVKYSTLELTLIKNNPRNAVTSKIGFGSQFTDSLAEGWNNFVGFILGLISYWPFLLAIPVLIILFRKWRNRRTKSKE
ncbi:DUF4349 domain-containing protein [Epilithonimonas arachidiradicis]|uniref:Uncharacterized protein DUF4349 n=1 Tax=Epilithonimonas arachidiradicis TaxID=1617282 RepID=A0A420CMW9_9FLAO|nr:DUF4349 domain-containing protein [Epilithonimonas arachidiradicis]RKE79748.1 uncharacterized protein DUF4349 [Epilithonimonas arachidiradicis]GGG52078.1 hypothetical protein GCM10007332_12180 [Epilithonimonas arachidiradicis]